jgi:hypothetical protein
MFSSALPKMNDCPVRAPVNAWNTAAFTFTTIVSQPDANKRSFLV